MPVCKSRRQSKYKRRTYKKSKRKYSRRNRRYLGGMEGAAPPAASGARVVNAERVAALVTEVKRELTTVRSRNAELEQKLALFQQLLERSDVYRKRILETAKEQQQQRESELREAREKAETVAAEMEKLSVELQKASDSSEVPALRERIKSLLERQVAYGAEMNVKLADRDAIIIQKDIEIQSLKDNYSTLQNMLEIHQKEALTQAQKSSTAAASLERGSSKGGATSMKNPMLTGDLSVE